MLRRLICFMIDIFYICCMGYLLYYFTINDKSYIINKNAQMSVDHSDHNLAIFHMFLYDIMFGIEFVAVIVNVYIASIFIPSRKTLLILLKVFILFFVFQLKFIIATYLVSHNIDMLFKCEIYCSVTSLSIQILIKYLFSCFKNEDAND